MGQLQADKDDRALSLTQLADVLPNHPMRVEFCSTVTSIERPRRFICRLHVDTDSSRALGDEPFGEATKQLRSHPIPAILRPHRNPLPSGERFAVPGKEALWYSAARLCTTMSRHRFYSMVYRGIPIASVRVDSVAFGFPRSRTVKGIGADGSPLFRKWALSNISRCFVRNGGTLE